MSSVAGHMPLATAAAEPLDEPPGMKAALQGSRAGPKALTRPVVPMPSVCMFVLPMMMALALFSAATATASLAGTRRLNGSKAAVVLTPAVS